MKMGFIGAGKVGLCFGLYLQQSNFTVTGYFSRSDHSARTASMKTGTRFFENISDLVAKSEGIFITTNDDQIETACRQLADSVITLKGMFVAHMSGALSSEVLESAHKKGAVTFSLHPLQAFADVDKSVTDLKNTYFGIEGQERLEILEEILKQTGNPFLRLLPEQKTRYHIIACVVSNYLVALIDYGVEMFGSMGIDTDKGLQALMPMIKGTVENIAQLGLEEALTGPIARGDLQTIEKQLGIFGAEEIKQADTYRFLNKLTLDLALKNKLKDEQKIEKLKQILSTT